MCSFVSETLGNICSHQTARRSTHLCIPLFSFFWGDFFSCEHRSELPTCFSISFFVFPIFIFIFCQTNIHQNFKKMNAHVKLSFFFPHFPRFLLISFACENLSEYQHTREILFLFFVFENIQGEYPSESDGVCTHQHTLCLTKCVLRFTKCVHKDSWD